MNAAQQSRLAELSRQKPTHSITERRTPISVILHCSCGWSVTVRRNQNALARTQKVYSAKRQHLEAAP